MFEAANTLIENRLRAQWSTTTIEWPNVEYNPVRGTPFVRLAILWVSAASVSVGGLDRGEGYINLSVFTAANKGTQALASTCDSLAAIFRKWESGGLTFKVPRVTQIGRQEEWFRWDLIIPFKYDECNPPA
jgi:hypothetical protein